MLKNTKDKVNLSLYVFVGYVDKRGKKRKREKKKAKSGDDYAKFNVKRATDSKLEQAGRKSKFKEASHLPISPVRDQLW